MEQIYVNMFAKSYRVIVTKASGRQAKLKLPGYMVPTIVKTISKEWLICTIAVDVPGGNRYVIDENKSHAMTACNTLMTTHEEYLIF